MARVNNGNLLSYDEYQGGAGYPQFLSFHQDFGYDAMDRLTSANDSGGWSRTFQYDPYGNMWVSPVTGPATAAPTSNVYDANNRLLNVSYDAAGNQLVVNGNALGYDAEGRVTTVSESAQWGGGTEMYLYDGEGRRVKKSDSNGKTVYVYDAAGLLAAEYSTRTQPTSTCSTCYLATDHLGTTRLVMDQSGAVVARHDFFPFGEEIAANSAGRDSHFGADSDVITQKFTGKERDQESGLDYFGARYYGSALGRFTSPDRPFADQQESDPQSWNLYSYVRNNPLRFVDPTGLDCITTSNQSSGGVTVTTERGGSADTCSGTYVNGTVNLGSYSYNGSSLTWSDNTAGGGGAINFVSSSIGDWGSGSSNMLGAHQIGMTAPIGEALGYATLAVVGGAEAGAAYGAIGGDVGALGLELLPSQARNIQTIDTIIADHVTMSDLAGGAKEAAGFTTRVGGRVFDHQQELRDAARGLTRAIKNLEGSLNDPSHGTVTRGVVQQAIQKGQTYLRMINVALGR